MNLRQLEIFLKVTESGSFLAAANNLFMSQSAVSQQIMRLEQELGFPLFHRNGHGIRLTEAGTIYASGAREILEIQRTTVAACLGSADLQTTVACMGFSSYYFLPQAIKHVQSLFPQANIVTCRIEPGRAEEALEHGEVNLIFIPEHIAAMYPKLKYLHIIDTPLFCVLSKDNPLSRKEMISCSDLVDSTIVMPEKKYCSSQVKEAVSAVLAIVNHSPSHSYSFRLQQGSDIDNALLQIRTDSRCVAIVPAYTLPVHTEIVSVPLAESSRIGIGFAYLKKLTMLEEELVHDCQKIAMYESVSQ